MTADYVAADYVARLGVDRDCVPIFRGRQPDGLDEWRGVFDAECTECRCDQDEDARYAACGRGPAEFAPSRRFTANDLMHTLMGKSKLLGDFP